MYFPQYNPVPKKSKFEVDMKRRSSTPPIVMILDDGEEEEKVTFFINEDAENHINMSTFRGRYPT